MIRRKAPTSRMDCQIGMRVRVKRQIMDPEYPDLPLGGWHGRIVDIQEQPTRNYLIRWSRETLANIHPVYRKRCEEDDVCLDQTWLLEEDLEPDAGGPLLLERPVHIGACAREACPC